MKIIRPIDLTGAGVVESNAPGDHYTLWEAAGRDYSIDMTSTVTTSNSTHTYVGGSVRFVGMMIRRHSVATGVTETLQNSVNSITDHFSDLEFSRFQRLFVSPNGNYLAGYISFTVGSIGTDRFFVLDTQTETVIFSELASIRGFGAQWDFDSSRIFYVKRHLEGSSGRDFRVNRLVISGLSNTAISPPLTTIPETYNAFFSSSSDTLNAVALSSDSAYVFFFFSLFYTFSGRPQERTRAILRCNTTTGAHDVVRKVEGETGPTYNNGIIYNDAQSHIIAVGDSGHIAIDANTFGQVSTPLPQQVIASIAIDPGSTEIVIERSSTSPALSHFGATDYLELSPIPVDRMGSETMRPNFAGEFIVINRLSGFLYIERLTGQPVEVTNPTVTAGDIYTYQNHNYEALQDNNDRPDLGTLNLDAEGNADPTWLDLGFINPLRMFDNKLDSRTTAPSPLVIDVTPGMLVNGLALFNVDAATVQITYTDPDDGLVYDTGQISMLDNSGVQDWHSFFFDPYLVKADLARVDLPAYIDGTVQITLDGAGADVAIGEVVLGTIYQIGEAQYGSSAGIIDFSRKEADQFGNFEIVPRRFSKRAEFDAVIPPAYGGSVQRTLARLRATPIVWIGSVDLEETIVYGYFREFDILLSNPAFFNVTITVEGL